MTLSGSQWVDRFAAKLGLEAPSANDTEILLDLAGLAAHASQRTAAPISCWLVARAGLSPADAYDIARTLLDELGAETAT